MVEARTKLHNAVLEGNLQYVREHIGCGVNAKDEKGRTALMLVSVHERADDDIAIVEFLLQSGANKFVVDRHGDNALHYAVKKHREEIVNILLENGMGVNSRDGDGNTPLIAAAQEGYTDIVKILICHRADIHMRTRENRNALYFALWNKHDDTAKYLLEKYCGDNERWPELELACQENNTDAILLLLHHELNLERLHIKMCVMNARSLIKKRESFKHHIIENDFDVCMVTETWFSKTDKTQDFIPNGYSAIRKDQQDNKYNMKERGGGVLIVFKTSLSVKQIHREDFQSFECVEGVIKNYLNCRLICMYWPPDKTNSLSVLQTSVGDFEKHINALNKPNNVIIAGDFNVHLENDQSSMTKHFNDKIKSLGLKQHITEFTRNEAILDLLITDDAKEINGIKHYKQYKEEVYTEHPSDHIPVHFKVFVETASYTNEKFKKAMEAGLLVSSEKGYTETARLLLNYGVDIDTADTSGETALHRATINGKTDTVKCLLENGINVDNARQDGCTALMLASEHGHIKIVELLIEQNVKVDKRNEHGKGALHFAVLNGWKIIVLCLLDNGCDVNASTAAGDTALMMGCLKGHTEIVRLLVKYKADVNKKNAFGRTALHFAVLGPEETVVDCLLNNGSDVNASTSCGNTPLMLGCREGYIEIVRLLITGKADVNKKNASGHTALHFAVRNNTELVAACLLDNGCDVDARTPRGDTALMMGCRKCYTEMVQLLIKRGADINRNVYGATALHIAVYNDRKPVAACLLNSGCCDVDACTSLGDTALMMGCRKGHTEMVRLLIERGADINTNNNNGDTALDIGRREGHSDIVEVLKQHGRYRH